MRVDKREFIRVFSTLMSWSNENKSCMRVDRTSPHIDKSHKHLQKLTGMDYWATVITVFHLG